ncbi:MAG: bifunctional helix-turn-helix domain-containing protein/methylated-DNA--[protein]-cysteine S-methyltransferase [Salinarimonas sp.]|nr:bifunctional helix-turn-helix domain-containing protein/methylated-DNA--[protein]-cysteine S-methyltransferase [Salinarimonas sp.]
MQHAQTVSAPDAASSPEQDKSQRASDYEQVRAIIAHISQNWRDQPDLERIAADLGLAPVQVQRLFKRWAGLTPKAFLQAVTLDAAKRMLADSASVLDTAYETGLSGPSRLHDLFVTHEALSPGEFKRGGGGVTMVYGYHPTPFGEAIVVATPRGLAGLGFVDDGARDAALADMRRRWPNADFSHDDAATSGYAARVFEREAWQPDQPLRVVMIGTDFELRVWETLLRIPFGRAATYSDIARQIGRPKAARAVGAAVGRNPISFVVPCHRVIGRSGALTGYHWGLTRKRAILGWESGLVGREP